MDHVDSLEGEKVFDNPFHPSLVNEMIIQAHQSSSNRNDQLSTATVNTKITNEALVAAGEVLRLFVKEAWYRASIEAECEYEGVVIDKSNDDGNKSTTIIRADHIVKIAAELLMDFS
jgi:hypothetical protein